MAQRLISATEFKAKCLALLDEVEERGENITITKRGKPVATLTPVAERQWKSLKGIWKGKVKITSDIVDHSDQWECVGDRGADKV